MSSTVRPDNLRAALDAKLAAAMSQLVELREAEQPRITPHLNAREIVGAFLLYTRGVHSIVDTFGRTQAGALQFDAWYDEWTAKLSDPDRARWKQLRGDPVRQGHGPGAALLDDEISVASDPSITARTKIRKRLVRFATAPERAASEVCDDYLRLARRFADDFVRDHARFLP